MNFRSDSAPGAKRALHSDSGARDGQLEKALSASIAGANRKSEAPRSLGNPRRPSLHEGTNYGEGFVWFPQLAANADDDLPAPTLLNSRVWLAKAVRERRRARLKRAFYCLIILGLGAGSIVVWRQAKALDAFRYLSVTFSRMLTVAPL